MTVHRHRFWQRAMLSADIGFGESYTDGDWDSPDLVALLSLLALREEAVNDRRLWPALAGRTVNFLHHLRRDNTPAGSRRNISAHYDLGNDFYRLFLDPTMCYSSGLFLDPADSLETAQRNKIHAIIDRAAIGADDHVPEIGCGWGGFALETVRAHRLPADRGDRVPEQHAWWNGWCARPGWRGGSRCSSPTTATCRPVHQDRLHRDDRGGRPPSPAQLFPRPSTGCSPRAGASSCRRSPCRTRSTGPTGWARTGSANTSSRRPPALAGGHGAAMAAATRLNPVGLEDIGSQYVPTLAHWRETLLARRQEVLALGFDETFLRRWTYYFSYCEAGFRTRLVRNYLLVLARMGEPVART